MEQRLAVLALSGQGLGASEIARRTGVPRSTVRGWLAPRSSGVPRGPRCARCGRDEHRFQGLPGKAYAYLLGLYLGDGDITAWRRGVWRLRVTVQADHFRVQGACAAAMEAVLPGKTAAFQQDPRNGVVRVNMYSKEWPCLFPQHGPGPKHQRNLVLTGWQQQHADAHPEQLLRGLVHSDGCRGINTVYSTRKRYEYPRYMFSNRSEQLLQLFTDALDRLEIPWRRMNRYNISVARREGVAALDAFIEPKR